MSNYDSQGIPDDVIICLEDKIRSAGNYVVPSDDLRPMVIEAAKARYYADLRVRALGGLAICALLAWGITWPCAWVTESIRLKYASPTSAQIQQAALDAQAATGQHHWALVDAFERSRVLYILKVHN